MIRISRPTTLASVAGTVLAMAGCPSAIASQGAGTPQAADAVGCLAPSTTAAADSSAAAASSSASRDDREAAPRELDHFAVSLVCAKVGSAGEIDVTLMVRNLSHEPRSIGSGTLQLFVEDVDGLSVMNDVPLPPDRGSGSSFEPELGAKGETRLRYVISPFEGAAPLKRLNVREFAEGAVASFDVSPLRSRLVTTAPAAATGTGEFVSLTDFDVRLDRMVTLRNGQTELFYTLRNSSRKADATSGEHVVFKATGARGGLVDNIYQFFPARGDRRPTRPATAAHLEPGATAQLRTFFEIAVKSPVVVTDGRVERRVSLPEPQPAVR